MHSHGVFVQIDHPVFGSAKGSGLKINNVIIANGTLLLSLCAQSDDNIGNLHKLFQSLLKDLVPVFHNTPFSPNIKNVDSTSIKFKVIYKQQPPITPSKTEMCLGTKTIQKQSGDTYISEEATLCLLHYYNGLTGIMEDISNWTLAKKENDTYYEDYQLFSEVLPTFIVLMLGNPCLKVFENTFKNLYKSVENIPLNQGDPVVVESTPFGNLSFFNAWSHGIISKRLGSDGCGFLTDSRLVCGCEGAPVYVADNFTKGALAGIILHTMSWCNGEWVGFSVGLCIKHLLRDVLGLQPVVDNISVENLQINGVPSSKIDLDLLSACIVFVRCANKWGSGVVIDSEEGIILTCSHIVDHDHNSVKVVCKEGQFKARVIYASPLSEVYDVALISVGKIPGLKMISLAGTQPVLGEKVITAGYPLSTESLVSVNRTPTLSAGCVSKISPRGGPLLTTCCTQSGVSGGALIRPPDQLLGIVLSNVRLDNTVLPSYGLSVSMQDIKKPIVQYLQTKDPSYLKQLCVETLSVKMEWALQDCKL